MTATGGPDARGSALVTGASRGIGAATARRLASEGFDLALGARSEDDLRRVAEEVAADHAVEARAVPTDVTDPEAVENLVETAVAELGRLDAVVVNAGTGERRDVPLADLPLDEYERVRATNVDGAFYTTRAVLAPLRETGGTLVFVGSYKGHYPSTSTPVYAASKWWLRGFAKSVAGRVGGDGVAVSVVNPSGVPTEFARETRDETNADRLDPEDVLSTADVADAIATAVQQDAPGAVTELDLFRRDIYERF